MALAAAADINGATRRAAEPTVDPRWPQIFPRYEPGERIDNVLVPAAGPRI